MAGTTAKATLPNDDLPLSPFPDQAAFHGWLSEHHDSAKGLWLLFYKKSSETPSLNWEQAVEAALCFGWIDGLVRRVDERSASPHAVRAASGQRRTWPPASV
jgi:uncharacterized protein YdeI (YjbR/CyaY-like superfamily)